MKERKCCVCGAGGICTHIKGVCYCNRHYRQMLKYGKVIRTRNDPNKIIHYEDYIEILLYDRYGNHIYSAIADKEDVSVISKYKWSFSGRYAYASRHKLLMHKLILNYSDGDLCIDHIDGNGLNNRKSNLRLCSMSENSINRASLPSNNTSGFMGVTYDKCNRKWRASISIQKKQINLGNFSNKEDCIKARINGELRYYKHIKNI